MMNHMTKAQRERMFRNGQRNAERFAIPANESDEANDSCPIMKLFNPYGAGTLAPRGRG